MFKLLPWLVFLAFETIGPFLVCKALEMALVAQPLVAIFCPGLWLQVTKLHFLFVLFTFGTKPVRSFYVIFGMALIA